ncbi:hypothetical protein HYW99_03415, partial [Candidatus Woesearchaeota archaeon]|nr:hypothetical protein [Candidatus Woesearchaeota archaeon]
MKSIEEKKKEEITVLGIVAIIAIVVIVLGFLSINNFYQASSQINSNEVISSFSAESEINQEKNLVGGASSVLQSNNPLNNQQIKDIPVDRLLNEKEGAVSPYTSQGDFSRVLVSANGESVIVGRQNLQTQFTLDTAQADAQIRLDEFNGYIIKLKDLSLAEKFYQLKKEAKELDDVKKSILKQYKEELIKKQDVEINSIRNLAPSLKVRKKFVTAFNGFSFEADEKDAEKLKKAGYKIWPNWKARIVLMDSVPLINADDVWKLDKDGNDCTISGNECLTGKGIRIAIIDTGVDYTHADLGGCFGAECKVIGGYDFVNNDNDPMD